MTRGIRFHVREDLGKPVSDERRNLGHEIIDLFPFIGLQIVLELRMNGPLSIDLSPLAAHQHPKEFNVPARCLTGAVTGRIPVTMPGGRS
jgi:hypothetical protein